MCKYYSLSILVVGSEISICIIYIFNMLLCITHHANKPVAMWRYIHFPHQSLVHVHGDLINLCVDEPRVQWEVAEQYATKEVCLLTAVFFRKIIFCQQR